MNHTYYDIFKVSPSATAEEIKIAYRKLALKHHPDRTINKKNTDSKMKEINFIYTILSDPYKRKCYDSTVSFDSDTPKEEQWYSYSEPFIFCNELEVTDSLGVRSKLNIGDNILLFLFLLLPWSNLYER